ncbi:MAG: FAD-dependent oxidoreductase [Candidatus Eremiobacteraeota bacterium]|nr:FAD-dependent oxidoreductase [Candidatus Eremiobacteraeota bacterium]MBC5804448.1 FAD-dependent oxidoreductase [Candidatus Eremiobacteraeota bacterium]MBC5821205.1 FAD-dependent oxidoreductase [Candidatus Eremiobacteraeota bacterium]
MLEDVDLIVIGSGQGGSPLALAFAGDNKRVVLFERGRLGGSCVNYGCTPSKAYLAAAHNAGRARAAGPLGVDAAVRVDGRAVMERVREVRDGWHDSSEKKFAGSRVDLVRATASFTGVRTVAGGGREVRAPLVVIDTGTSPACPPIGGLADTPYFTNMTWFDQITLPPRLAVIGGGYIGLELGQGAQRLGSAVTICTSGETLMPSEDADAVEVVRNAMERDGVTFQLDCKTTSVRHDDGTVRLAFDNGTSLEADAVLVAAGRTPNTAELHVDRSGVRLDDAGFVAVDDYLQTACPGVYALGDVAHQPAFTHVSWEDYRRLRSTFSGTPRKRNDRVLSYATFTEPQLARTGLTEREAKAMGRDVRVQTLALEDVARGEEWNLTDGFYRLVVDASSDAILGATLVGYEAAEIVHTLAFAIHVGATRRQLDDFMAIHPTFSEGLPSLARP